MSCAAPISSSRQTLGCPPIGCGDSSLNCEVLYFPRHSRGLPKRRGRGFDRRGSGLPLPELGFSMSEFNIGFVIFLAITQLDFSGPFEALSRLGTPPRSRSQASSLNQKPALSPRRYSRFRATGVSACPSALLPCHGGSSPRDCPTMSHRVCRWRTQARARPGAIQGHRFPPGVHSSVHDSFASEVQSFSGPKSLRSLRGGQFDSEQLDHPLFWYSLGTG
jgi:hypothetical protein